MRGNSDLAPVRGDARDAVTSDIAWLSPDAELWVASSSTDFVGVIEFSEGHFIARDCRNRSLGTFSDLRRAKLAVQDRWESRTEVTLAGQLSGFASRLRTQTRAASPFTQTRAASPRLAQAGAETVA